MDYKILHNCNQKHHNDKVLFLETMRCHEKITRYTTVHLWCFKIKVGVDCAVCKYLQSRFLDCKWQQLTAQWLMTLLMSDPLYVDFNILSVLPDRFVLW